MTVDNTLAEIAAAVAACDAAAAELAAARLSPDFRRPDFAVSVFDRASATAATVGDELKKLRALEKTGFSDEESVLAFIETLDDAWRVNRRLKSLIELMALHVHVAKQEIAARQPVKLATR
jgi:hypothetical protein